MRRLGVLIGTPMGDPGGQAEVAASFVEFFY
jgi:hypothetical protein